MSTTVISKGFIAALEQPIPEDARKDAMEALYNELKGYLNISYDGKLLFSDENAVKSYSEREFYGDLFIIGGLKQDESSDFVREAKVNLLKVREDTIQPYTCVWYNGSDDPMSELTYEEFMENHN